MDTGRKTARVASTSGSNSILRKSQESINIKGKSKTTDAAKAAGKAKPFTKNPAKTEPSIHRVDGFLHESVKKLSDRTKHVKSKLSTMKISMNPPTNATPITQNTNELSEEDIHKEIARLQNLVREIRLKSSESGERRDSERNKSFQSDVKATDGDHSDKVTVGIGENVKRDRVLIKNSKDPTNDIQLQELYQRQMNEIVSGPASEDDPMRADLQFKLGDDLDEFAKKCVEAGLGRIIESELRVNAKNNRQAFLTLDDGPDAMIPSTAMRKYAMDGDVVSAFIRNSPECKKIVVGDGVEANGTMGVQSRDADNPLITDVEMLEVPEATESTGIRRAFVIRIEKENGNRVFVGSITFKNPTKLDNCEFFKFIPRDTKVPMIYIPVELCQEVLDQLKSDDSVGFLYLAEITAIKVQGRCIGKLQSPVGKCGNLESEIKAILLHNNLKDVQPFEEKFEKMWSDSTDAINDLQNREDLRGECIFTIDPLTARDLDDAVSCKLLPNGCYEIGVHISDVSSFLEESCELDELVKMRATSIYLVNEVIHMLPKSLCMKCSLLPEEDKRSFSVFWVMNDNADIISTRFARSMMRSCTQFAYEHAQKIIDNPNEVFTIDDFPAICNGFTVSDIVQRVQKINSLAEIMRTRRFENGSMSINKPQYYFQFDPASGEPISYQIADRQTANYLIEEFMLLANQSVAQFIYKCFPQISFLRSHQPPKPSAIRNLKAKLSAVGIDLDMSSSKSIFKGLNDICGKSNSPEEVSAGMNYLLTKPMMRAKYFCSESVLTEDDLRHYALAIPIYTHFTSPIRRYPDILVHRLLSAALDYTLPPKRTPEELHDLAKVCNDQKFNAKNAGEESANLYFQRYVKAKKSIKVRAVVTDIYRHSMEVITLETGHLVTIQFKLQKVLVDASKAPTVVCISEKNSKRSPLELKMFSALDVKLVMLEGKLVGFFASPDWDQRGKNNITEANKSSAEVTTPKKKRNRPNKKARLALLKTE